MSKKKTAQVSPAVDPQQVSPVVPAAEPTPLKVAEKPAAPVVASDPLLAPNEFQLNGRTHKYALLSYDFYLEFLLKIKPLLAAVAATFAAKDHSTVTLPGIELVPNPLGNILQFCGTEIPDMVRIIINNSLEADDRGSENVTIADIKKTRGITPMQLANIVMGQVVFNDMIPEFGTFFMQALPLLKAMGILTQAKPAA